MEKQPNMIVGSSAIIEQNLFQRNEIPVKSFSSRYQLITELGSGSFGTVSLYKMKKDVMEFQLKEMYNFSGTLLNPLSIDYKYSNDLVAIKTMNKKLKKNSDYSKVKEIQFIFSVNSHFNLVQIIDIFIDKTHLKLNIVMENMDQNLYQLMKARRGTVFSPKTLKSILSQLLNAILHIHKHLFFHRDVKPENILVMQNLNYFGSRQNIPTNQRSNSYIIKLADYGLARHSSNKKQFTAYVSTRWYRSPEILFRKDHYSFPIDIWAFGCVAVECAIFQPLFPGKNELDQCCKIMDFLGNPNKSFYLKTLQNNVNFNNYTYSYLSMQPFGGFWDDANNLAIKLGLMFPKHFGYRLENLIKRNDFDFQEQINFFQMVKSCLTWDPNNRASAYDLFNSPYFKNSIYILENQKENDLTIDPITINKNYLNENNIKDSHINSSLMFAGISPTETQNTSNNKYNNYNFQELNVPSLSSNIIKIQPGLGIQNKFNIINTSNLLQNASTNNISIEKKRICSNNTINNNNNNINKDMSIMQLTSDLIDIYPMDENLSEFETINTFYNEKDIDEKLPIENIEIVDQNDNNQTDEEDDDEEEEDDDDDEFELYQNVILPMEFNKIQTFLQESQDLRKIQNVDVSVKNDKQGNYDLIDEINYALDDEFKVNHHN
jgi:meiosis induction protein kinase IME2/SME1